MAILINEEQMINENVFAYEERVKSPITRFVDKSFTPVTYFHINNSSSTTDQGYVDVEEVIGENSPLRFEKIEKFPLYGIESIMIAINETDQGLDGSYEGEATILPGTIKPSPNDFFVINHLKDSYLFRVTEISYDNVMPDNFYKINYILEYIDDEKLEWLYKQATSDFTCIIENIGTDDKCIIQADYYDRLKKIDKMYIGMCDTYKTFYYIDKYNCLLGDIGGGFRLYDPLQTVFINKNSLFNKKNNLETIILTEQFDDPRRKIKYNKSIYKAIEERNALLINECRYTTFEGINNKETSFFRYFDESVRILDIPKLLDPTDYFTILSDESVNIIRNNLETDNKYLQLIRDYINNKELDISMIDLSLDEELLELDDSNLEVFFITPIILYIIKRIMKEFMNDKTHETNVVNMK